jgi:alpha-tubulin suppressor-like RCC1 family protein
VTARQGAVCVDTGVLTSTLRVDSPLEARSYTVTCWGSNTKGQIGNGTTSTVFTAPSTVVGL